MSDFNSSNEFFVRRKNTLIESGQRYGTVAKSTILLSSDVTFVIPKWVENADQRGSLSGKVVQIEQFKTGHSGSPESGFDLFLVTKRLQLPTREEELTGQLRHAMFAQKIAENLEILGFQIAGVFWNFF